MTSRAAQPARTRRPWWRRALRIAVLAAVAIVVLPYLIAPFYRLIDPISTLMAWRALRGERVIRVVVPINRIAPALPYAVIVAEDARFCQHRGVDLAAMREAIADADELADLRGGSTIAQQTAKNLFLWPGRSFMRKGLEFPLALWLDLVLGKRRLMEIYLNIAEWGPNGEFGAEAASRRAFRKGADRLTHDEAALLAAALPNPHQRDTARPGPGLRRLASTYRARAGRNRGLDDCLRPS